MQLLMIKLQLTLADLDHRAREQELRLLLIL